MAVAELLKSTFALKGKVRIILTHPDRAFKTFLCRLRKWLRCAKCRQNKNEKISIEHRRTLINHCSWEGSGGNNKNGNFNPFGKLLNIYCDYQIEGNELITSKEINQANRESSPVELLMIFQWNCAKDRKGIQTRSIESTKSTQESFQRSRFTDNLINFASTSCWGFRSSTEKRLTEINFRHFD